MKKVGVVTEKEKQEILLLFERKNALKDLLMTLESPHLAEEEKKNLRIKIEADQKRTSEAYNQWWRVMGTKYDWEPAENGAWEIEFDTNQVFINKK